MAGTASIERPTAHVRMNVRLAGRRINDSRGSGGETLCGAALTVYDVLWRDARRAAAGRLAEWVACEACRSAVANVCRREHRDGQ